MESGLAGERALVVGGASGIGRAVALLLASEGVHVAVASRRPDPGIVDEIRACGVKAARIEADMVSEADIIRMVVQAADALSGLDRLVYVAATITHEAITRLTRAAWESTLATNLTGAALACREVARVLIRQQHGGIVLIGSTGTASAQPLESAYRASKAGLAGLVGTLAVELAPHSVRVNLVTPGAVDTPFVARAAPAQRAHVVGQIPLLREALPGEIAPSVVFLLSDRLSPYTTGAELLVDGGLHLRPLFPGTTSDLRDLNLPSG